MDPLQQFLATFKQWSDVFTDSYFVVDAERNIVDYNRAFFSMLPRQVARGLKGKKCYEVLEHDICKTGCTANECGDQKRHVRLDEINSKVAGNEQPMRFILSAIPILDQNGNTLGAV